ncbi:MAG TPA: DNA translocase FtsK [Blastocatellia bacterium]|nr:DNA translocase FtsK [Blastocatellia bacterium]
MKSGPKPRAKSARPVKKGPTLLDEIIGLGLAGLGVIVLLALVSYDSNDPSWHKASSGSVSNWVGPVGANIASSLHAWLGWVALIVPIVLFAVAWWRIREPRLSISGIKMFGLLLVVVASAGLLAVVNSRRPGSSYLGGMVGQLLVYDGLGLASYLSRIGTGVALLVVLVAGLLMATPLSLVAMVMQLSPHEQEAGIRATLLERFREWREGRAAERALREAEEEPTIGRDEAGTGRDKSKSAGREESPRKIEVPAQAASVATPAISKTGNGDLSAAASATASAANAASPVAKDRRAAQSGSGLDDLLPSGTAPRARPAGKMTAGTPSPGSAAAASAGAARRASTTPANLETGDDVDDEVMQEGESAPDSQRSIEEMLATAEVRRSEIPEEDALADDKMKPAAKAGAILKNILRSAKEYKLPSTDMLTPPAERHEMADTELMERAQQLAEKCKEFNVSGQVKHICPGPVVTTFEFKPDPGVKYSRVTSLVDDLCLGLKAESIRIDRIPGKSTVGIEVPNDKRETIRLREVIESKKFRESESKLTLALGKTIDGLNYVADLARMPHLLIAGATGAGKSVALNSILISLLCKATPDEVRLILIDPKRLELGLYSDIPHLLTPIVTDPKRASYSLRWAVAEMENRYKHLAAFGVRNIDQYNNEVCATVDRNLAEDSDELPRPLPYIVVIIDELADLMMVSARDVEESITRLAQMARAVGIHLVLATQRPSVDVITGLIKANFPSRISFRVSSKVDSRTIIDTNGAEALLGQGDMLFLPPGTSRLVRVHGAYVDEKEVKRIADHARAQGNPIYDDKVQMSEKEAEGEEFGDLRKDEKYEEALRIVIEMGRASTSVLQRRLRIGYGRAASIIDMMYREGIVGPEDGSKPRAVLVKADFLERLDQMREEDD